ncbi:hypothetical protein P8C59_007821 [Phyllachora maydis]|uniref:Signal peptide-containing protein n=1 Tax=Phyllachora maydis TaxID=1825666 RepID=A0AAD9IB20_9PEZI|nr:hypothetical protein P8C59_007821 [Phyllachora maydis]
MSFPVALQSAVFYILACTPCAKVRHRQKAKVKAKREREEKARLEAEQPDMYRHPDPFNTNPYWAEEIMMGPRLPKKGAKSDSGSKNASQRGLTGEGHDKNNTMSSIAVSSNAGTVLGSDAPSSAHATQANKMSSPGPSSHPVTLPEGSPTVVPEEEDAVSATVSTTLSGSTADDWNRKRYQREDEELWGNEHLSRTGQKLMDAIKQAGSSAGRYVEQRLGIERQVTAEARQNFYYPPRNPPVNDYHPPVVSSKPAHRDAHKWMLQPPPPAKVMEGKVPVSRSGSLMSVGSRRTAGAANVELGRRVGEKAVEAKLRKGEGLLDSEGVTLSGPKSRRTATTSTTRTLSQRTTGGSLSASTTDSDADADDEDLPDEDTSARRRRRRRTPRLVARTPETLDSEDEDEMMSRSPEVSGYSAVQRPRLSTILSSEFAKHPSTPRSEENAATTPAPASGREPADSPRADSGATLVTKSVAMART